MGQEEQINTDIVTLTRFLTEEQVKHKEATGDFTYVLDFDQSPRIVTAANKLPSPETASSATPCSSPSSPSPTTSVAPRLST